MSFGVIKDCIITKSDSVVLLPFINSSNSLNYRLNKYSYNDGINIQCSNIYTPCNCVVLQSCKTTDDTYSIIIQYSDSICLRYTNVEESFVIPGQLLLADSTLGRCSDYVHFEYLTTEYIDPNWVVRVASLQLYKHDPMFVLDGSIEFDNNVILNYDWPEEYFVESYPPGYIGGG